MSTQLLDVPAADPGAQTPDRDGPSPASPTGRGRLARALRGRPGDPTWARPALLGLLAATAVLYLWGLSASGYANEFYAAAVQAGTKSWKALFFGSFDASNYITVDKPPASLWVMALSGRVFGFSSWSLLAPQALEGVAAVALLYGAVRRTAGHAAGLAAGAILALTPAAVLMFRFDNPDALLTLLLVAAGYAVVRALESGATRWIVLAGAAIGFGFLTKMGQALVILPALGLAYAVAGPPRLGKRLAQLAAGVAAVVVSAGWWVAIVELWPASARPYIGGSTTNSVLDLAFGYNGLSRLLGGSGGGGGGTASSGFGGASGLSRLFSEEFGQEIGWLLPAALIALLAGLWLTRKGRRTDSWRAQLVLWGGWLLSLGLVLSFMEGVVHPYYSVALAPAVAALVAIGGALAWRARHDWTGRLTAAAMIAVTGWWSADLLAQNASWLPVLRPIVLVAAGIGVAALLLAPIVTARRAMLVAAASATAVVLAGAGAVGVATASVAHSGSIPGVGATATNLMSGGPGGAGGAAAGRFPGGAAPGGTAPGGAFPGGQPPAGTAPGALPGGFPGGQPPAGQGGPVGGNGSAATDGRLVTLLQSSGTTWSAATASSMTAAPLELASGTAVMAIGGFNGSDSAITLDQFKALVAAGDIHYYIADGQGGGQAGPGGQRNGSSQIASWVESTFTSTTVGTTTVYDLQAGASTAS